MNRRRQILAAVALTACGLVLAGCAAGSRTLSTSNRAAAATSGDGANSSPAFVVHVYEAQPIPAAGGDLLIPAALHVEDTALILAEREGRVVRLRGQEGARVAKGEVLAEFNDDDQRGRLRQAEIDMNRLKVEEQQYEALVKLNRNELEREMLLARDGYTSKSNVERAQYKLDQSTHEYEKTRLATQGARARIEAVKLEMEKSVVRAPIAGIITRRHVTLGTNVAKNDKLFEVSKLSPLVVKFQLPQAEAGKVSPGQSVNLTDAADSRVIAVARIRRIDPVADAASSTLGFLGDVAGGRGLMPGLTVNVRLPRGPSSPTFWVPRSAFPADALLQAGALTTLFVAEGERARARSVLVGKVEGDQVEVSSGLTPGERVILMPPAGLKDGDAVGVSQN